MLRVCGPDRRHRRYCGRLADQHHKSEAANLEARACKEILLTISVLIPKLQAARYVVVDDSSASMGRCVSCDEG